ncbi:hypothetical protein HBH47_242770 [Parastagonospora nodorum]|nr:hypothetical protein HBH47_242770 [Parastagonospora nodorum]
MDLDFVPSVAFIPDVHIADSLRARTLINLSAVLYEQAAARTGLPAEVGNMDLDFVPSVAFIPDVYIADSLRARTLINLSAVLYEQAAAQTGLPAEVGNISSTSLRARTLINLSAVLYDIIDLDFVPGVAFNAMGNVELTGDLLGDADRVNNNNNNERTASLAKRIKTNEDRKKDNMEELICVGKVKHTYVQAHTVPYPNLKKYLSNSVTDPTGREFSRVDMKSSTGLSWTDIQRKQAGEGPLGSPFSGLISMTLYIYVLRSVDKIWADVADVFDTVVSKSDKVPTQEPSSHIKTELYLHQKQALYFMLRDNSRKFYRLVITGENTHCKQTIKKAYIMSPERALLILFMT